MKYVDEYRDAERCQQTARAIADLVTRPHTLMEICGGQTHAIVKYGLDRLLPPAITLLHGPGCPVCVTPPTAIDRAIAIASLPEVVLCSFGDMLRVPGSDRDLLSAKATGADVRAVYSPLEAVQLAANHRDREVVLFAVGFETTAPATALALLQAQQLGLPNFSLLVAHVLVPPAMHAILRDPGCRVAGFLAAGHVCTIAGYGEYAAIAAQYRLPIVVTGFEPLDILQGIYRCVRQLETGRAEVENQYARSVRPTGNARALAQLATVFEPRDRDWRGMGTIPLSGLALRPAFADFDAECRFPHVPQPAKSGDRHADSPCISGNILRGLQKPPDCPAFGTACTPDRPLGAPMVSSEGACAAYYRYRAARAASGER